MTRSLKLRRDTLTALTDDQLDGVAGAGAITGQGWTCALIECAGLKSWVGPPCPTLPECP